MFKDGDLAQLQKIASQSMDQLKLEISIFDKTIQQTLENAPENDKGEIEEVKALATRAINLAKMGKAEEAQAIIKQFQTRQNERKNNK